jgi:thiol-disulfide isomerase/thioredoxin
MTKNQEVFEEHYRTFALDPEDAAFFKKLGRKLNVLVLAEDWCGDVLRYLPAFWHIAQAAGSWNVRVFYRDQNPDLAGMWLKNGTHRAIPVFVFFDEGMNELAHFIEKPAEVDQAELAARSRFALMHPELADGSLPPAEMSATTRELYASYIREFRAANRLQWQELFVKKIRELLAGVAACA